MTLIQTIAIALCITLFSGGASNALEPWTVRVVSVSGKAISNGKRIFPGDSLSEGDAIQTMKEARAKLLFSDRSVVDVGPSTDVIIHEVSSSEQLGTSVDLGLKVGAIRAVVAKRLKERALFTVRTLTSVLAVRGTEFFAQISHPKGQIFEQITVGKGKLEVLFNPQLPDASTVLLNSYQQWTVNGRMDDEKILPASSTSSVSQLAPSRVFEIQTQHTVVDQTFKQNVALSEGHEQPYENHYSGIQTVATLNMLTTQKAFPVNFGTGAVANRATRGFIRDGQLRTHDASQPGDTTPNPGENQPLDATVTIKLNGL